MHPLLFNPGIIVALTPSFLQIPMRVLCNLVVAVAFIVISRELLVLQPVARVVYGMIIVVASLVLRPPHFKGLVTLGMIVATTCLLFRKPASDDFEGNVIYQRRALKLHPPWHPGHTSSLDNLAAALRTRFENTGQMVDLEEAITHRRSALELSPPGHPDRSISLNNLAAALQTRFNHTGQMADLEEAITHWRGALDLRPPGHPDRSTSLINLAAALRTRFKNTGQMVDLEEAVTHRRSALELSPPGHPDRSSSLNNLADVLQTRFKNTGQMVDLEEAITHRRSALELSPPGHPDRSSSLINLADVLQTRFKNTGQMVDLEEAITHRRGALDLTRKNTASNGGFGGGHYASRGALDLRPLGHPYRSDSLNNLAKYGSNGGLEETVTHSRGALGLCPPGHRDRSRSLSNLATALRTRFNNTGQMVDLEEAITHRRDALDMRPPGHPDRSTSLIDLAAALEIRFGRTGQMVDLEEAITHHRGALDLRPPGHPDISDSLEGLGTALGTLFYHTEQMVDLEEAMRVHRDALSLRPPGHPDHSTSLGKIGNLLSMRFDSTGQMVDLEEAIAHHRGALDLRPPGDSNRHSSLINLASVLRTRFDKTGQMVDLEEAITYHRDALDLCPPEHSHRCFSLSHLAKTLQTRFAHTGQMVDLEEAITHYRGALALRPPGHPAHSGSLENLAKALGARFDRLACDADLHEIVGLLQSGTDDAFDTPAHRYSCASEMISILTKYEQPGVLGAFEAALNLLQLSLAVYPDVELRREALGTNPLSLSLAMDAAAHAIEQGRLEKAIELLEQGRGMLWSGIRSYRHPIEEVRQVNPDLAERFRTTSEQLEALATSSQLGSVQPLGGNLKEHRAVSEASWARQRQLSSEIEDIIQQIRQLVGFEHFLSAVPFRELQAAASEGPVIIINVAKRRSDIIILHQRDAPILLPLSVDGQDRKVAYHTIKRLSELLFEKRGKPGFSAALEHTILKTLEEILVTPTLEMLEGLGVRKNARIWWCPTSALCALPIHATGQLPIKYISSYTPTLSALISARTAINKQSLALGNASDSKPSLLAVIHRGHPPKTKDDPDQLRTVSIECKVIEKAAEKAAGPGRVCSLVEADATREAVLGQLPNYPWVHFACHGLLNISHPFQSAFVLENDPLSLSDLVKARLPNADLAFLAACDSATAGSTSATPDEALHLAAAVQFCGVRSVVGTLWPMADQDGPRVAQVFYRHMFKENDSRKSAEALHKVVLDMMRKSGPWAKAEAIDEGEFLPRWANYIHIGA
ncbi:TPR-like protein [Athelia psychrophila]|uniref:TPR-like protein n=1 Tax=Athelia psychrophila TaxID=1759441 RepID=A0A166UE33_9AGAM|nr:TPR-like protein [Fibularhizoctonia sp. CBS 109695]